MAKTSHPKVIVGIYRSDQAAEYNSPRAWKAHHLRARAFDHAIKHKSLRVIKTGDLYDEDNTHEFAEAVVEILEDPAVRVVLTAVGLYVFKHLTKPLDDWVEAGVKRLYKSLFRAFQKKQISEFFLQLPNGEQITVGPDDQVTITVARGTTTKNELREARRNAKIKKPRLRR